MKKIFILINLTFSLSVLSQSSSNISLIGSLDYPGTEGSDVWGYVDSTGTEYALVGMQNGFSVVNLSVPSNPTESFFIPGVQSTWRDIKVWGDYAYVTADEGSDGLLIVDLNDMTGSTYIYTNNDNSNNFMFSKAHNIFIDEFGKAYIFGGNIGGNSQDNAGVLILDVTNVSLEQENIVLPEILGLFDNFYLHDGMARGDTLWGSAVYEGYFFAIDVSNPSEPVIFNDSLAFHQTPNAFTHNCWISDDGNTLFTTDEQSGAYIAAFDVSDLSNIQEIDRIRSSPEIATVIPHNAHVYGDFLVTSYYRDGIVIHDISNPSNMVEVGHYDAFSGGGDGFDGSWGAYPYLPSGLVLSTEINSGPNGEGQLLVLDPEYERAAFLEGHVKDSLSGNPISNATIRILTYSIISSSTNLSGNYFMGIDNANTYEIEYSKEGYFTDTAEVTLVNGEITLQNIALLPKESFSKIGKIVDSQGNGIPNCNLMISSSFFKDTIITNQFGEFSLDTLFQSNYTFYFGSWGYRTKCEVISIFNDSSSLLLNLDNAYYDDFTFDYGWAVEGNSSSGMWEIGNPNPTIEDGQIFNPSDDISNDCYNNALVTGNALGGGVSADDVDDGYTLAVSPKFDLSSYNNPAIKFYEWFANSNSWSDPNDTLNVYLSNGIESKLISTTIAQLNNQWLEKTINISQFIQPTTEMTISFKASDYNPNNHLVEAGIDGFEVFEDNVSSNNYELIVSNIIFPNPANNEINVNANGRKDIYNISGKLIYSSSNKTIDVSRLESGLYIINTNHKFYKFIKL
ncbi:MAG: hypothetical protein CMD38_03075 [Flavobacteriales bacterium]|nr:hypothetical protein [Flavobacteriales bacterium]